MSAQVHSSWSSPDGAYVVTIGNECFDAMVRLARKHVPVEIGTPLVGSYSDDGRQAHMSALAPVSADSHGARTTFHRGVAGLRRYFRELFKSSRGRSHYVGEWHSHPGGAPFPSPTDETNMLEIANDPKAECAECILLILGLDEAGTDLAVYVFSRARGRVDLKPSGPNPTT